MVAEKQAEWEDFLEPTLSLFRTSTNPTTKFTPYSLLFSRKANLPNKGNDEAEQDMFSTMKRASTYMAIMQEQQNAVKSLVIANMNAAYKQEKKNAKRRMQNPSPTVYQIAEPLFVTGDSPAPKKLKDSLYVSFPIEMVLATEQSSLKLVKTELTYRLADSVN